MDSSPRTLMVGLLTIALAAGAGGCGEQASTSKFKGESHNVAQAVSDFQSDVTAGDQTKLCQNDLAGSLKARLQSSGGCVAVVKRQLHQIDQLGLTIESVAIKGSTASARVKSTWSGKNRITTLSLVKEGSRWKVSGAQ